MVKDIITCPYAFIELALVLPWPPSAPRTLADDTRCRMTRTGDPSLPEDDVAPIAGAVCADSCDKKDFVRFVLRFVTGEPSTVVPSAIVGKAVATSSMAVVSKSGSLLSISACPLSQLIIITLMLNYPLSHHVIDQNASLIM